MKLLGCRVVRGPDWKWDEQDGGEGGVGTIVSIDTFSNGKALDKQNVLARWDNGECFNYRLGLDGNYDLRVLDSAPSGVHFTNVTCDGCGQNPFLGTRWKCTDCDDYDLCTYCYNNDIHELDHNFMRYDRDQFDMHSTSVGQRSSSVKVQAKGIFPGSEVTNGNDSEDDLGFMTGIVIMDHCMSDHIPVGKVLVKWCDGTPDVEIDIEHRLGCDGKVDLKLKAFVPDIYYYRDHLLTPSIVVDTDEKFQVKDKVTVHLDLNDLHQIMSITYGYWEAEMERAISEVGIVENVDGRGILVKFETLEEALLLPNGVLSKVHDMRVKDKVKISGNKEKVKMLQKGHSGWNDQMEKVLGKEGIVTEVDEKRDANVKVGEATWWFNPAALILESKEEEREPPSTVMTDSAKEAAKEDDGTLRVGEFLDTFVKVMKDEEVMSQMFDEYKSLFKSMPPITVVVGDDKGRDEVTTQVNTTENATMTEEDDSLKGQVCAAPRTAGKSKEEFRKELESSDEDEDESVFVRPTNMDKTSIPSYDGLYRTDNVYKMTSYPRGIAVIVNIEHFNIVDPEHPMYGKLDDRVGSKKDEEDVTRLFRHLGFIIETINKTAANDLFEELHTRISKDYDFSAYDCFVLCIMSHGTNDSIYTSDGMKITRSLIVSLFRNSKCKSLAGKPKLFFFQACRGEKEDLGVTLADAPGDKMKTATNYFIPATPEPNDADEIPETADILEFYSCYVGFNSYRNSETGSPFIQSIVEVFRKYAYRHHILELITKVKKRVSDGKYSGKRQMPHHNDTLTKHLYFWPGVHF